MYAAFKKTIVPAQERRLASFDSPEWVDAMAAALAGETWFRWFDSGDLQSTEMLRKIAEVARRTPHCQHWLATRERKFVTEFLTDSVVPSNMVIRVSATFPDVPVKPIDGVQMANVHWKKPPVGFECRAPDQGGQCGDCRACWSRDVPAVSYRKH